MALFKVPGWTVPSEPVSAPKKRKRPTQDHDESDLIQSAAANMEKLMKALGDGPGAPAPERTKGKRPKKQHEKPAEPAAPIKKPGKPAKAKGERRPNAPSVTLASATSTTSPKKAKAGKEKNKAPRDGQSVPIQEAPVKQKVQPVPGMTAMQAKMKQSLDGARFRWINEELYKTDGASAHKIMRDDPKVFEEYHTGFRHQVQSWPTNPVSLYISQLSSYPPRTVIADLGCGDAALARALVPQGMTVLSFDLVSDNIYVIEADTCQKVPLPGSEGEQNEETAGEGQVVDVAVCALSLMGTNWPATIREMWRILKRDGELKVAEVASRFSDVDKFISLVCQFGFQLQSKDASNTHFTLFEFKKQARKLPSPKSFEKLLAKGDLLKPCEYKRR